MQIKSSKDIIKVKTQKSLRLEVKELRFPLENAEIYMEITSTNPLTFADGSKILRKKIKKITDSKWRKMTINFAFANVDALYSVPPQRIRLIGRDHNGNIISNYLTMHIYLV